MRRPQTLFAAGLLLLLGLPLGAQEIPAADPCFDYGTLGPTDQHVWDLIQASKLDFGKTLDLALEGRTGGKIRAYELVDAKGVKPAFHRMDVLWPGPDKAIQRAYVRVGLLDGKILAEKDVDDRTCAADPANQQTPQELWDAMAPAEIDLKAAVLEIAPEIFKAAAPLPKSAEYKPGLKPRFEFQMYQFAPKGEIVRHWDVHISAVSFKMERRILIDRFPGEPLRRGVPTEHPNGMFTYDLIEGDGELVTKDSIVKVHYRLFRLDGAKLVDSYDARRPHRFPLNAAPLKGMTIGIEGMRVGGRRKMAIPASLAYGTAGSTQLGVPPNAMVVVDLDVLELGEGE